MTAKCGVRSLRTLLDDVLTLDYFDDSDGPAAIPALRVDGKGKLIVVVGDNASGKSFFRRIIQVWCQKAKTECIHISVEGRGKTGHMPWLAMVYGDEQHESTGVNSMSTILMGMKTCRGREKPHTIFWDEPDLGLSEDWAAGVGQDLCKFAQEAPTKTKAAFIVTHSRALVRELLPASPFYLHLGTTPSEAPQSLQEWVDRPIQPQRPEKLKERSRARYKAIQAILNRVQA